MDDQATWKTETKTEPARIGEPLPERFVKTLGNVDPKSAKENVSDLKTFGSTGVWQLLCKAWSDKEGWMKSTKVMEIGGRRGCLVQVSSQQRNADGTYSMAEALTFVPGVSISGEGEHLKIVSA